MINWSIEKKLVGTNASQSEMIDQTPEREDNRCQFGSSKPAGTEPAIFFSMSEKVAPEAKKSKAKVKSVRKLTVAEKAEIAALYRTGSFSLDALALKFKKSKVTIAKVIKDMGIKKGDAAEAAAKKLAETIEHRVLTDAEETMRRIAKVRQEHYGMASALAHMAFKKVLNAERTGVDIASLKDVMITLKLAGDVVGNARKELFDILDVERYANQEDMTDLPELMVRELMPEEITQLQHQADEFELEDQGLGAEMLSEDPAEGA